jgi:hypothetical protein
MSPHSDCFRTMLQLTVLLLWTDMFYDLLGALGGS